MEEGNGNPAYALSSLISRYGSLITVRCANSESENHKHKTTTLHQQQNTRRNLDSKIFSFVLAAKCEDGILISEVGC